MHDWTCLFTIFFIPYFINQQYKIVLNQEILFKVIIMGWGLRVTREEMEIKKTT